MIDLTHTLTYTPRVGQRECLLEDQPEEYRRLIEGNYKIIYVVEDNRVDIINIFDCRRHPDHLRESIKKNNT